MLQKQDLIVMGKVLGPVGLKGFFRVRSYTEREASLLDYSLWHLHHIGLDATWYKLDQGRLANNGLQAKLKGINDRDSAEYLKGATISINKEALKELPEDEYYWHDLVGLRVINRQGGCLGQVKTLMETGAKDVLVVSNAKEAALDILIPFVALYVDEVRLEEGIIRVDWQ